MICQFFLFCRHEQRQLKYLYHYRFQVPDSPSYDVSTSQFKNEKLENYNWNYLDQYICTRGEGDYGLLDVGSLYIYLMYKRLECFNMNICFLCKCICKITNSIIFVAPEVLEIPIFPAAMQQSSNQENY